MGRKLKIILSDLHLGAGHAFEGGNYLEDFTADEQLIKFLHEIGLECERDQREVELIINGDFFEFLQIPAVDDYDPYRIYPKEAYLDSSEEASVKRLNIIYQGHPTLFNALSDFMHVAPQRRITIIKGNHDVNLFWPGVKSRLRDILGTSGSRASLLLFAEEFVSREKIYVEHGHQRAEKMNSYNDFLDPRLSNDPSQLYYPTGSHFVINVFNEVERERWFVDSIKPLTALIWYALKWDFDFAAKILASFISHTPALLISDFAPDADGAFSNHTLLDYLKDDAKLSQMAKRYQEDTTFRQQFHRQIQRYLDDAHVANKSDVNFQITDINSDPLVMGQAEQQRQQNALRHAAEQIVKQEGAQVVVFGHTHYPVHEQLESGSIYINTGCWLWKQDLSNASMATWEALFKGTKKYIDTPGYLPYARIDYDEDNTPTAQLLNFTTNKGTTVNVKADQSSGLFTKVLSRLVSPLRGVS